MSLTTLELCAGGGGQAIGLERAGFSHAGLVELDKNCCRTLRLNRPEWTIEEGDLRTFDARNYVGVDLVSGGLPCPPFSVAGKQLGENDERNLFPAGLRIIEQVKPKAVMIENVRGILDAVFEDYRKFIAGRLAEMAIGLIGVCSTPPISECLNCDPAWCLWRSARDWPMALSGPRRAF